MNIRKTHIVTQGLAPRHFLSGSLFAATAFAAAALAPGARAEEASLPEAIPAEAATVISNLPPAPTTSSEAEPPVFDPREFKPTLPAGKTTAPAMVINVSTGGRTAARPGAAPPTREKENIWLVARKLNLALPLKEGRIVVWKSKRQLELWKGNALVKTYPVALGAQPVGHKYKQGDGRTPEGEFFICTRNATSSAFHIFLGLSYPALPDAKRAVNNKAITWPEYRAIQQRLASRSAPLWRTRLGGWVGIHGGSGGSFANRKSKERGGNDWTAGCIALTDRQIEEIYAATRLGTPVSVRP